MLRRIIAVPNAAACPRATSAATATATATACVRRHAALQSEHAQRHWSNKVVRKAAPTKFFAHPMYVMAREKLLSKMWREHVLFGANAWYSMSFFAVAFALKA